MASKSSHSNFQLLLLGLNGGRKASRRRSKLGSPLQFNQLENRSLLAGIPVISEFMASNDGTLLDEDGASSDWIEIYNAGDESIDLAGWSLTDDADELTKWSFPSTTLEPSQFLVVFASGNDRAIAGGELHTNFKLKSGGEYLGLVEPDGSTIAYEFAPEFPLQLEDVSYGLAMESSPTTLVDDTTLVRTLVPSDGSLGTSWTATSFDDSSWESGPDRTAGVGFEASPNSDTSYSSLINAPVPIGSPSAYARFEFELANVANIDQLSVAMQYDDGFVAYLNGVRVASDNAPASPVWNSTATGGMPDDQATDPTDFDLTDFRDELVVGTNVLAFQLLNRSVGSSDLLLIPELVAQQSMIVEPQVLGYFEDPTPGEANGDNALGFTIAPTFSVTRGFYDSAFDVALASETPEANIYYTTDGSEPSDTNGSLYTGPVSVAGTTPLRAVAIKDDFFPSPPVTHTYLFASDIITQPSLPTGYPTDWGTHNNHTNGNTPFTAVADYEIDTDVVGPNDLFNGVYTSRFEEALTSIPTVSLAMNIDDAFDGETGFYANSLLSGRAWEREMSVEWWDPSEPEQFQVNAGIRAHGGAGRQPWRTPKHAMRFYFRKDYGPGRLDFPLFGDEGVTSFDRLVLRSHYNDSWQAVSSALHNRAQYIQDPFVRKSFADMGNLSIRSRPVNVYINGLYWGVYDITERPDAEYFADHLGGEPEDYDVITHGGVQDGDRDAWDELLNLVRTADLTTSAGYEAVKEKLDVKNLVDYMLVNFYTGTDDWPHNNWVTAANKVDGGGFRFYVWDAEISMNQLGANRTEVDASNSPAELYDRLRVNEDFRRLFADRVSRHMSEGSALSPPASIARYSALADQVEPALVAESARWGDVHEDIPRTPDEQWATERDWILNTYLPQRTDIVRAQLLADGLASDKFAPTDITLSATSINENLSTSADRLFAELSAVDTDPGDSHTYELWSGNGDQDNDKFVVVGDQLLIKQGESIDYETQSTYFVRLQATDSFGLTFEKEIQLDVNNLVELSKSDITIGQSDSRSRITTASIVFDGPVTIEPDAFLVSKRGPDGGSVDVTFTCRAGSNDTIIDLVFDGEFVGHGSLVDGYYDLVIVAGKVLSDTGNGLDINGDGDDTDSLSFGDTADDQFFRFYGDHNGDATVDVFDLLPFRTTYRLQAGSAGYIADFDVNNDDQINIFDLLSFRQNYRQSLTFV
jgi:hypothetical protein